MGPECQTTSPAQPVNWRASNFNVSIACVVSVGAILTYKVQYTYDNVFDSTVTPTWYDHLYLNSQIASADGNIDQPVVAIRLNVTNYTNGDVTMTLITQGGD